MRPFGAHDLSLNYDGLLAYLGSKNVLISDATCPKCHKAMLHDNNKSAFHCQKMIEVYDNHMR